LALITCALALLIACFYAGIAIIVAKFMWATLLIGLGLIAMSIFVFVSLISFMFKRSKVDLSGYLEVDRTSEPRLFAIIDEVVKEVNTSMPKHVYLTPEVNASVFFNSSFWSMFFPVKKNLTIGLGLMNTHTEIELKGIIAHEFGHFSQKSLRLSSYVYHVNKIIYSMIHDNENIENIADKIADWHQFLGYFVQFGGFIIKGIKFILRKVYVLVNLNYLELSREMEFNADEVAVHVVGKEPMIASKTRSELADYSYRAVINYSNEKINESQKPENIYEAQRFVMHHFAKQYELSSTDGIPMMSKRFMKRFATTKLEFDNQWSSHPSHIDRIEAMEKIDVEIPQLESKQAMKILSNASAMEKTMTNILFKDVEYEKTPSTWYNKEFTQAYQKDMEDDFVHPSFNGYYNRNNIGLLDIDNIQEKMFDNTTHIKTLFTDELTDKAYALSTLNNDIETMKNIGAYDVSSFDYDGKKYKLDDVGEVLTAMLAEQEELNQAITAHNITIYQYFLYLSSKNPNIDFKAAYKRFLQVDKQYELLYDFLIELDEEMEFTEEDNHHEVIEEKLLEVRKIENRLKAELANPEVMQYFQEKMTDECRKAFEKYVSKDWDYFVKPDYNDANIEVYLNMKKELKSLLLETYYVEKRKIRELMIKLETEK
jgi:Zn-dependent protease with chaperone function